MVDRAKVIERKEKPEKEKIYLISMNSERSEFINNFLNYVKILFMTRIYYDQPRLF